MSLRDALMRYFDSDGVQVALFRDGLELKTKGYTRQEIPRKDGRIEGRVVFGPFQKLTRIDEVMLMDGNEPVQSLYTFTEPLPLPPGAEFAHDMSIEVM